MVQVFVGVCFKGFGHEIAVLVLIPYAVMATVCRAVR